jgi:hypothetical protein
MRLSPIKIENPINQNGDAAAHKKVCERNNELNGLGRRLVPAKKRKKSENRAGET